MSRLDYLCAATLPSKLLQFLYPCLGQFLVGTSTKNGHMFSVVRMYVGVFFRIGEKGNLTFGTTRGPFE